MLLPSRWWRLKNLMGLVVSRGVSSKASYVCDLMEVASVFYCSEENTYSLLYTYSRRQIVINVKKGNMSAWIGIALWSGSFSDWGSFFTNMSMNPWFMLSASVSSMWLHIGVIDEQTSCGGIIFLVRL